MATPPDQLLTPAELARVLGVPRNRVRQWVFRGQLEVAARNERGHALLAPSARPRLGGPTLVLRHFHGGLLATAGGPGKLRRVSLKERAAHRGLADCGCEVCMAVHEAEQTELKAKREALAAIANAPAAPRDCFGARARDAWDEDE